MIPVPREVLESVRDALVSQAEASDVFLDKTGEALTAIDKILEKNDETA